MTIRAAQSILDRRRFKGWILLGTALVSFAAGSLFTARLAHLREVRQQSRGDVQASKMGNDAHVVGQDAHIADSATRTGSAKFTRARLRIEPGSSHLRGSTESFQQS